VTHDVVITGLGVFSALGFGEEALLNGVFGGVPAFRPVTRFDGAPFGTKHAATFDGTGPLPDGIEWEPTKPAQPEEIFRFCADKAIAMSRYPDRSALALVAASKLYAPSAEPEPRPAFVDRMATALGLGEPRRIFVNACVAAASAVIHAAQLIRCGEVTGAVVGAVHLVDQQIFAEFDAVRALSRGGSVLPFDTRRQGVLLGDAAGAIVLESADGARARGARPLAGLSGWAVTSDAFHIVKPKPDGGGVAAAITESLRRSSVAPSQLGYVNAHGTATVLNDRAEVAALQHALGSYATRVPVSSTKSTTGHALQACGLLELVITMLALRHQMLPPTAGLTDPESPGAVDYVVGNARPAECEFALSLNSAVGGMNTALLLKAL
jgi:3-oxoacyl-[acyl-carrier-protein] synthase II